MRPKNALKHGHSSNGKQSPTYQSWASMIKRCKTDKRYFSRGIKVCYKWYSFENFFSDMGEQPAGKTLERINNNLGYLKSNCRWASRKEQARNRRTNRLITFRNRTLTLQEWSEITGIYRKTISWRLDHGWSVLQALTIEPL